MAKKPEKPLKPRVLHGVAAAPGIAVGKVRRVEKVTAVVEERRIGAMEVDAEIARFDHALMRSREEIAGMREATRADLGESQARIFDVQLEILRDPLAVDRTLEAIREERRNAEFLFHRYMLEMAEKLEALADSYFSERAVDLMDVKRRVLRHLQGGADEALPARRGVLVAHDIAPSQALMLDPEMVLGFVMEGGGATGHAAIMARARGIPGVVGAKGLLKAAPDGSTVALDGFTGKVIVNPSEEMVERMRARKRTYVRLQRQHARLAGLPAQTLDGHRVTLSANMELPAELEAVKEKGGEGIGLFRTEFFMISRRRPAEEEQYLAYRGIVEAIAPHPVVIRVLDVGGDKIGANMGIPKELNPFLGLRGIRYLMAHRDLFRTQLRAILRAGAHGNLKILFPMISGLEEFRAARRLVRQTAAALEREGIACDPAPPLGAMIEVPSLVMMADEIAKEADFLSVGSNDLVQYMLAVDRNHELLHDLFQPRHPAVLRALARTVEAAHRHGREISICGEMAGEPLSLPLLMGMGFDVLSVNPHMIPEAKQTIRALRQEDCRELAAAAQRRSTPQEVTALIEKRLGSAFSDLLRFMKNAPESEDARAPGTAKGRPA